jgi:hypothetical protein
MALDGTYGVVYCGADGLGLGVFNLKNGSVVGYDYVGGRYHGTAKEEAANGKVALDLIFEVPPGVVLVQGTAPQDVPHSRRITQTLPAEFGDGTPVEFNIPPGPVTAMIKRIPDGFEPAAFYGFKLVPNPPPAK